MCIRGIVKKVPWLHGIPMGVEANPDKIQAILEMSPLKNIKEV